MARNIAYIFQPHFKTMMLRPSCGEQQGTDANYVVVTCSPTYNGVWRWDASKKCDYSTWSNNGRLCYCVPLTDCVKVKELSEVTNPDVLRNVRRTQDAWEALRRGHKKK